MNAVIPMKEFVAKLGLRVPHESGVKGHLTQVDAAGVSHALPGQQVFEGTRNATLASLAGTMVRRGMDHDAIQAALRVENQARMSPPLSDAEVAGIVDSISRYASYTPQQVVTSLNDTGNADRFVSQHGADLRYDCDSGSWIVWNGRYWENDTTGKVLELAKETARTIFAEAAVVQHAELQKHVSRHANSSNQQPRLRAMVELARSDPRIVVRSAALDQNDHLLGTENGVIDLRDGSFRPHRREDLVTRIVPVHFDPRAKCPQFRRFLWRAANGDPDLYQYLQRMAGYWLTGSTKEQALFFLYGGGANGKSTFLNAMRELLGPGLAKQMGYESLTHKPHGRGATNDLARLEYARLALTSEIEDGRQLDESLVKQMTGGEAISARYLFKEFREFVPKFKLVISGNHKPIIRGDDHGIWRRIQLVPFTVTIPPLQQDPDLAAKLRAELPGILNFAIRGAMLWREDGLSPPAVITNAVEQYRADSDLLGQWIDECCKTGPNEMIMASEAYSSYRSWAGRNGLRSLSAVSFGKKLVERYPRKKTSTGNWYEGISVQL